MSQYEKLHIPSRKALLETYGVKRELTQPTTIEKSNLVDENTFNTQPLTDLQKSEIVREIKIQRAFNDLLGGDFLEKSVSRQGLTPKKVQIKGKDGKTHQAIRWVREGGDESHDMGHSRAFKDIDSTHTGSNAEEKMQNAISDESRTPTQKAKDLIRHGVYDKDTIVRLSGANPQQVYDILYYGGVKGKDFKDEHDKLKVESGEKQPTSSGGYSQQPKLDIDTTISEATELLKGDNLRKFKSERKRALAEKYGVTVNDRWDSYEVGMMQVVRLGTPKSLLAYGTGGVGKAAPLTSLVLTPYGFKTMGEIQKGDQVVCPDGRHSEVLEVFPQGIRPVYEITFKDGRKSRCDENHLWKVKERQNYTWKVLQLKDLLKKPLKKNKRDGSKSEEFQFGIPLIQKPFQHKHTKKSTVNPWLLGYLLGDGGLTQDNITFSCSERDQEFILSKLNYILNPNEQEVKKDDVQSFRIIGVKEGKKYVNKLNQELKKLGVLGSNTYNKKVPLRYFNVTAEEKLELVRGLMDSDGYITKDGFCQFTSTSRQLAEDFRELVNSLGSRFTSLKVQTCNVDRGVGQIYYDVTFMMPNGVIPVSLPFKVERIQNKKHPIDSLSIVDIQYVGEEETKCILIDHPEHLYITDDYIVTHNTYTMSNKDKSGVFDRLGMTKFDPDIHDPNESGQWDFAEIGGSTNLTQMFDVLYKNRDKTVVFDDCDSMWDNPAAVNILKKILDSSGDGLVNYAGSKTKDHLTEEKITQFKFTGKVVFISNLTREDLEKKGAGPIVSSRAMAIDLTMTRNETLERIENLVPKIKIRDNDGNVVPVRDEDKKVALGVMKEFLNDISEDQLNVRVFNNLASKSYFLHQMGMWSEERFLKEAAMQLL